MPDGEGIDFVIAARRVEGVWQVSPLATRADLSGMISALRLLPADDDALAFVSVDEDFFVLLRVRGANVRMLLSDATAADEWLLAREVLDALDSSLPDE